MVYNDPVLVKAALDAAFHIVESSDWDDGEIVSLGGIRIAEMRALERALKALGMVVSQDVEDI